MNKQQIDIRPEAIAFMFENLWNETIVPVLSNPLGFNVARLKGPERKNSGNPPFESDHNADRSLSLADTDPQIQDKESDGPVFTEFDMLRFSAEQFPERDCSQNSTTDCSLGDACLESSWLQLAELDPGEAARLLDSLATQANGHTSSTLPSDATLQLMRSLLRENERLRAALTASAPASAIPSTGDSARPSIDGPSAAPSTSADETSGGYPSESGTGATPVEDAFPSSAPLARLRPASSEALSVLRRLDALSRRLQKSLPCTPVNTESPIISAASVDDGVSAHPRARRSARRTSSAPPGSSLEQSAAERSTSTAEELLPVCRGGGRTVVTAVAFFWEVFSVLFPFFLGIMFVSAAGGAVGGPGGGGGGGGWAWVRWAVGWPAVPR